MSLKAKIMVQLIIKKKQRSLAHHWAAELDISVCRDLGLNSRCECSESVSAAQLLLNYNIYL